MFVALAIMRHLISIFLLNMNIAVRWFVWRARFRPLFALQATMKTLFHNSLWQPPPPSLQILKVFCSHIHINYAAKYNKYCARQKASTDVERFGWNSGNIASIARHKVSAHNQPFIMYNLKCTVYTWSLPTQPLPRDTLESYASQLCTVVATCSIERIYTWISNLHYLHLNMYVRREWSRCRCVW